ncbi:MAG: hypothetical protein IPJ86_04020 [Bacteroidetes bacterium]|nr:hypothetical protein [Bacteroidota bacterium]
MKTLLAGLMLVCISTATDARTLTFGEAVLNHLIEFQVKAETNNDRRMQMTMNNISNDDLEVEIETGRVFYASEEGYQPFVITRTAVIALEKGSRKITWHHARCGNSGAKAPSGKVSFTRSAMGPKDMVITLNKMNGMQIVSSCLYQAVVWHYTNNHSMSDITASDVSEPVLLALTSDICNREHKSPSWYSKEYAPPVSGNDLEFSGVASRISAKLNLLLPRESDLEVQLRAENGKVIRIVKVCLHQPPGTLVLPIDLNVHGMTNGKYSICVVNQDKRLVLEREFYI